MMMGRLSTLDSTSILLLLLVVVRAWTVMGWSEKILTVCARIALRGLPRLVIGTLFFSLITAVAWTMTGWAAWVSIFVGTWRVVGGIVKVMQRLLHAVGLMPHRPRLLGGECVCPRYDSWADHGIVHRSLVISPPVEDRWRRSDVYDE
jgi:hypothetical protein